MQALEKNLGREFEDIIEQKLEGAENSKDKEVLGQNLGHVNNYYQPMIQTITDILEENYVRDEGELKIPLVNRKSSEIERRARNLPDKRDVGSSFGRGLTLLYEVLEETENFEIMGIIGGSTGVSKKYPLAGINYSEEHISANGIDDVPEKEEKEAWLDVMEGLDEAYFDQFIPNSRL